jgi:hypothetical protein
VFTYRTSEFTIRSGRSYVVKIFPTSHTSTDDFRTITLSKRGCRLKEEKIESQYSMFKYYTRKTCIFECTLKKIIPKVLSFQRDNCAFNVVFVCQFGS